MVMVLPLFTMLVIVTGACVTQVLTVTLAAGVEVLALTVLLPRYLAVMLCRPSARPVTEYEAVPPDKVCVPSTVTPSRNCTVSPAVPLVTVAVRLRGAPKQRVLGTEPSVVDRKSTRLN